MVTDKDHINIGTGAHQWNLTRPNNALKKSRENETNEIATNFNHEPLNVQNVP